MKKFLITIIFLLSCIGVFSQTTIPPASTWTPARNIINANFENVYDSIAANRLRVNVLNDSILAHVTAINLRLLKSDTTSMLANYTRNGELNAALAAKVNVSDTAAMLANYALTSELGDAGTSIGDVRDEIADSLNVLRPLYVAVADTASMLDTYAKLTDLSEGGIGIGAVQDEIADSLNVLRAAVTVGNGTKAPYFDGTQDGGQILYFYGDNGFWTALQGGAPVANRSYRLPIAALPSAGTTSLLNIDQYGNMGFVGATSFVYAADTASMLTNYIARSDTASMLANYLLASELSLVETRQDSIIAVLADSVNIEALLQIDFETDTLADLSEVRLRVLRADSLDVFVTPSQLSDSLDAVVAGVVIGDVRDEIADSLNVLRPLYIAVADTASMLSNYLLDSETAASATTVTGFTPASGSLTLSGADALTITTTASTNVTLPTSGTLATTAQLIDTLLLRSEGIFVFGAGGGNPGDTATFSGSGFPVLGSFNTGRDTLMITQVIGQLWDINTTDTLAVQIMYADSLNQTSFTTVWSSATGINADGLNSTSFASAKIPPRKWVWSRVASVVVGRKPTMINMEVFGYRIKAY